jgi:uncharacterized membrane protein
MSKQKVQRKENMAVAHGKSGASITGLGREETHEFDDSPLPSADDLVKLNQISPEIVPWLMKRAEDEQSFRHATIRRREEVLASVFANEAHITKSAIHWAGFILLVGMAFSAFLVHSDQTITGSIFAGAVLVGAASLFLGRSRGNAENASNMKSTDVASRKK